MAPDLYFPDLDANEPICPYTGLRTFTEDEAIYFRGREEHIGKCLELLAVAHFVMVTGASGDGKSSLVFAGMLPEVRAGFVRARYGNWVVATFRPERSPLRNMAEALTGALRLPGQASTIENELQQGFSALVELYETSALCPPNPDSALPPAEQRRQQRQAANLLLVVDQFEEFFTNPENYDEKVPNAAARTTVNLLLETARLARERALPIYIVGTMRSDFVGQCAEFRGLIEQVGASQYFVPRLLRHEFAQVIRDPATFSGNRISERLVQRLVLDTNQGQDQLPVLQHALRRIWLAADKGREEMDLRHYAMVGGFDSQLPPGEQARFAAWAATLPAGERDFLLGAPSLRNVLDAHAQHLFAAAGALYNRDFEPPLPPGTAERVIEQVFRVLTRTDGKRVVRNRLTGAEITAIIDDEALPWPVVCRILRPFRQPDATFLSPFIGEDADDHAVPPPETVLDLTHESLIRNWQQLSDWAKAEAQDVRIATNLLQEAARWQAHGESVDFLLTIGLYTFFAQWLARRHGLTAWLAYYFEAGADPAQRWQQAEQQHTLVARYVEASRHRLRAQLLLARYGVRRLLALVLLPLLVGGLAWQGWQWRQRQDDYVVYHVIDEQAPNLLAPQVQVETKARLLLAADRLGTVAYVPWLGGRRPADYAFPRMLDALHDDTLAVNIGLSMYSVLDQGNLSYDSVTSENPAALRVLHDVEHRLDHFGSLATRAGQPAPDAQQRTLAVMTARTIMALTHYRLASAQLRTHAPRTPAQRQAEYQRLARTQQRLLGRLLAYVRSQVQATQGIPASPVGLGFCLRVLLAQGSFSPQQLDFLNQMDPYGGRLARQQFNRLFPPELTFYTREGSIGHSGGYVAAALAQMALHHPDRAVRCMRTLATQVKGVKEVNGGFTLLPYLVKYEQLTPANLHQMMRLCASIGGFPVNELYAGTLYSLLSVRAGTTAHDVSQPYNGASLNQPDAVRLGGVNPEYLDVDRASYSLAPAVREVAWRAILGSIDSMAVNEEVFSHEKGEAGDMDAPQAAAGHVLRNALFLRSYVHQLRGIYLHEVYYRQASPAQREAAAEQEFVLADAALVALQRQLARDPEAQEKTGHGVANVNYWEWNLGPDQLPSSNQTVAAQDCLDFLRQATRPKTMSVEDYYVCPLNALFRHEARHAANLAATAGPAQAFSQQTIELLRSDALNDAIFPDRYSAIRSHSLGTEALSRPGRYQPNLLWLRTLVRYPLPGDTAQQRQQALLLTIAQALRDSASLGRLRLNAQLRRFVQAAVRDKNKDYRCAILASNLATALAGAGRIAEALRLADWLGSALAVSTKLRIIEQAMLTGNRGYQAPLDSVLRDYSQRIARTPRVAAYNSFALLYWRPYPASPLDQRFSEAAVTVAENLYLTNLSLSRAVGYGLAGQSYRASQEVPSYQPQQQRLEHFNLLLLALAHRLAPTPGWREYDQLALSTPFPAMVADYDGPVN